MVRCFADRFAHARPAHNPAGGREAPSDGLSGFSQHAPAAAKFGLLLLCAVWILAGLTGRVPWRGSDGEVFVDLLAAWAGGQLALPPLYFWVASATAWLSSPMLALHDGARLASGVFVALALWFTARAARASDGKDAGWPAALVLLGSVGLLVRAHELNPYTSSFAAAALVLYALARVPHSPQGAIWLAGGLFLLVLAGGAAEAAVLSLLVLILPALSPVWREVRVLRAAWLGTAGGWVLTSGWLAALQASGGDVAAALQVARWAGPLNAEFPSILGWFAWPAWPLAAWALYHGRRRWQETGLLLPLASFLVLLALYSFMTDPGEAKGLILLLPLALLGGAGLLTLRRGAANALFWFSLVLFGLMALAFWVYWVAHDFGTPARLANRLSRLGLDAVGTFRPWTLLLGTILTVAWIVFMTRVRRSPLRPILVWTAGMTFVWTLLMALFLQPLDRRLGFETLARDIDRQVPAGACIETYAVRPQAGALLAYHSGRDFRPADAGCRWLIVQVRQKGALPAVTDEWVRRAEIARPNNRDERFVLFARR